MSESLDSSIQAIFKAADEHRGGSSDLTILIQDDWGPMYTEVFVDGQANPIGVGGTPTAALAMALEWAEGKRATFDYFNPLLDAAQRKAVDPSTDS